MVTNNVATLISNMTHIQPQHLSQCFWPQQLMQRKIDMLKIVGMPNAFIQIIIENEEDKFILRMWGIMADIMIITYPYIYHKYITINKKG